LFEDLTIVFQNYSEKIQKTKLKVKI